jgi:hypothetical protein
MMIKMNSKNMKTGRRGVALLVVLLIIMAITIGALGFLSRSDVELACGQNMILRTQMDYLAESGLEHARGLVLNPQDIDSEYWPGATAQQLLADSDDYYDVEVVRDDTEPTDRRNYVIDCNSYRLMGGEKTGRSSVKAQLRLDPCIALWTGGNTTTTSGTVVNGDVYCNGTLINKGQIDGDVFASALTGSITGQRKPAEDVSLLWPRVTVSDFTLRYATEAITSGSLSGRTFGPYDPVRVCHSAGNLILAGDVRIDSMLVVDGDLVIWGSGNIITSPKNLPALLVTGDLVVGSGADVQINGLVVVEGDVRVSAGADKVGVLGGLFVRGTLLETTPDSSGLGKTGTLYNGPTWRPSGGRTGGALEFNGDNTAVQISTKDMNPLQGTISLWVNAYGFDAFHHYLFGHTFQMEPWGNRIQLYTNDENGGLDLGLGDAHSRHTNIEKLLTHRWYNVTLTWDGTSYVVYVDGLPKADGSYAGSPILGPIADIGNNGIPISRDESFRGLIDDVRIYNHVLDANDIPPTGLDGLVGHWKLDESGSSIAVTAAPSKTAIVLWSEAGQLQKWGQAAGAFFARIERE